MTFSMLLTLSGCFLLPQDYSDVAQVEAPTTLMTDGPSYVTTEEVVGLDIFRVTANQGVQIILYDADNDDNGMQAPLIRSRDALVRVFLRPQPEWENRKIRGLLEVEDNQGVVEYESEMRVKGESSVGDFESTLDFTVAAEDIKGNTEFRLSLFETNLEDSWPGSVGNTTWDSGALDPVRTGPIELVLVPVRYHADGSGRLPDTSEAQLQRYHDLMMGMYGADAINITVAPPLDYYRAVDPISTWDWIDLLGEIEDLRPNNAPSNTYYYGIFNAASSLNAFCGWGCILGLSNLAFSANDNWAKTSIGIGFTGMDSAETMVHEVGHAHGREHAPCQVSDADPNYPYPGATLGTWGYHILTGEHYNPNTTVDMMSYCSPIWVSDYTYFNLMTRVAETNGNARGATAQWTPIRVGPMGNTKIGQKLYEADVIPAGSPVSVELYDDNGLLVDTVTGYSYPFSHVEGATVLVPPVDATISDARILE